MVSSISFFLFLILGMSKASDNTKAAIKKDRAIVLGLYIYCPSSGGMDPKFNNI